MNSRGQVCVWFVCSKKIVCVCVYVGTHESASSVGDDSRRHGRPPVALASHSPVIAIIRRVISQRLMNITAAAITCEKVNSRTFASINYSLSGRRPDTQHLTPRPSHQGEKEKASWLEIRDMGLQHTLCLLLIKPAWPLSLWGISAFYLICSTLTYAIYISAGACSLKKY